MTKKKQPDLPELKEFKLDNDYNILNGEGRLTCFWMDINKNGQCVLICKNCSESLGAVTDVNIIHQGGHHICLDE